MKKIAIIDYGMGNLRSVAKALEHVTDKSVRTIITSDKADVASADHIVFPGQGAARDCMARLEEHHLRQVVQDAWKNKPFLGICMGLQILFESSEENEETPCLALIPGQVNAFDHNMRAAGKEERLKVPHMGWNHVKQSQAHPLWQDIDDNARFYFVHSFYVTPADKNIVCGETKYGHIFTSAVAQNNFFACQFHPEKSAKDGLQLLKNFVDWDGTT